MGGGGFGGLGLAGEFDAEAFDAAGFGIEDDDGGAFVVEAFALGGDDAQAGVRVAGDEVVGEVSLSGGGPGKRGGGERAVAGYSVGISLGAGAARFRRSRHQGVASRTTFPSKRRSST